MTATAFLRNRIREKGLKLEWVASKIGLSYGGFRLKLNGDYDFTQTEIHELCKLLDISLDEIPNIFFTTEVE